MSVIKCKMCGGDLQIVAGSSVAECEYCGTKQTLPKLDDERKANLYDRANHFRRNNEFDKAMGIYEQILSEDKTDADVYWSLVLCRYGIEYVEDPRSHRRIPTVNRAQFKSILSDEDYLSALQYADASQREVYEEEANTIDKIQKGILSISQTEEPYDVFICYKETDNNGRRTADSVLAQDLYKELTDEGLKVFFSRITLEDKLGTAYEPYIFAALNSAKVMVVLGTKPEHFNAVWVKNEWSRYLALIRGGAKKTLIPAYRDMDPYDLPEEFSHLQAQDMSKLGFMQDLIRGVKKIAGAEKKVVVETVKSTVDTAALLKRAFLFLEDGDWKNANEYIEKVLDVEPENGRAYFGKLMIDIKAKTEIELEQNKAILEKSQNYLKALRFCDSGMKEKLESINERNINEQKQLNEAKRAKAKARNKKLLAIIAIIVVLAGISIATVEVGIPAYYENKTQELLTAKQYEDAFVLIRERDPENAEERINQIQYNRAIAVLEEKNYKDGFAILKELGDYADSKDQMNNYRLRQALDFKDSGDYNQALALLTLATGDEARNIEKELNYAVGKEYLEASQYEKAIEYLEKAKSFENGKELYQAACYNLAQTYIEKGEHGFSKAYEYFDKASSFKDSFELKKKVAYQYASNLENNHKEEKWYYDDIIDWYKKAGNYEDAAERVEKWDLIQKVNDTEFLIGNWQNGNYYLKFEKNEDGTTTTWYNLPGNKPYNAKYYDIQNSIYVYTDENHNVVSKVMKLTLIDDNTMSVYCYSNGATYWLYR